ncbi:MAG: 16S rRNA (guanine(966)-N(2))-methyltransferase RsmD [Bacteroidota bacterium]|jgi:16S rRNA (guanine(966)-N(2))-methyltransferase RsmD|nr:16S rRNA (guanine(966)-N(2))-methyltransferase RsmD [Bacteroidota bacterium]
MRVIAGTLKGRTLRVPADATFRPTTDRVKESVFNILHGLVEWSSTTVCDLFAGSGSLGIEALSRGASSAVFVESHRASLAVLTRNLAELAVTTQARVVQRAVESFLRERAARYSLVFADPPYRFENMESLIENIAGIMAPEGLAVLEHARAREVSAPSSLRIVDRRDYGTTAVTFFQPTPGAQT